MLMQSKATRPLPADAVRILRDHTSHDGWIGKRGNGKVCFLANIAEFKGSLEPGEHREIRKLVQASPTYDLVVVGEKL